jgi:hypothetical protein
MKTVPSQTGSRKTRRKATRPLLKAALWTGGTLVVAGVVAVFAGQAWLEGYLKSEPFRTRVESGIGHHLNAKVQLAPFKRDGTSVFSESLNSDGKQGAPFSQLQLRSLRADLDLSALWRRVWRLDHLSVQRLDLNLENGAATAVALSAQTPVQASSNGWLSQFLPNHSEFGILKVEKATIRTGPMDAQQVRLTATQLGEDWEILAEGGELHLPSLPLLELNTAKLVIHQKACIVRNSRMLFRAGGEVSATGEWSAQSGTDIHARLLNVAIEPFLSTWWQTRLRGNVQGDLRFQQPPGNVAARELTGTLQLKNGKLEALPILSQLDTFLGNPRFRSVPLKTASARIRVTPGRTEIQELDLDGDGLIRLQGSLTIEGTQLQGQLQLGLSPSLTQWLPGVRSHIFTEQRDGYVWTPIQLSGTVNNPTEDLTAKLLGTTKDAVLDTLKRVVPNPGATPLPEAAKGVLDTLKSVIPIR